MSDRMNSTHKYKTINALHGGFPHCRSFLRARSDAPRKVVVGVSCNGKRNRRFAHLSLPASNEGYIPGVPSMNMMLQGGRPWSATYVDRLPQGGTM
jgi:hypothetical protein